jgi:hypothetical protein
MCESEWRIIVFEVAVALPMESFSVSGTEKMPSLVRARVVVAPAWSQSFV